MSGDGILGYWSRDTIHSSYCHHNNDSISGDESIEVSVVDGIHIHRYLEARKYSSCNHIIYHSSDNGIDGSSYQDTSHSLSLNRGVCNFGVDGRSGTRSQESPSCNCGSRFCVDRRVGYRSNTSHYSTHNPGGSGILLSLSVSSCTVDKNLHGDERL